MAVHIGQKTRDAFTAFADRHEAGRELTSFLDPVPDPRAIVLALPRGGIPVGRPLANALRCPLRPFLVRKLPIPGAPEMGFGAVGLDGTRVLNRAAVSAFGITEDMVERIASGVHNELRRRAEAYPGGWPPPQLEGRDVFIVDDGLATGYSMVVAAEIVRAESPRRLAIAVPVAPHRAIQEVSGKADDVYCLTEQEAHASFAVASFYADFHDLSDLEVVQDLSEKPLHVAHGTEGR